jgi:hypothetical protein
MSSMFFISGRCCLIVLWGCFPVPDRKDARPNRPPVKKLLFFGRAFTTYGKQDNMYKNDKRNKKIRLLYTFLLLNLDIRGTAFLIFFIAADEKSNLPSPEKQTDCESGTA